MKFVRWPTPQNDRTWDLGPWLHGPWIEIQKFSVIFGMDHGPWIDFFSVFMRMNENKMHIMSIWWKGTWLLTKRGKEHQYTSRSCRRMSVDTKLQEHECSFKKCHFCCWIMAPQIESSVKCWILSSLQIHDQSAVCMKSTRTRTLYTARPHAPPSPPSFSSVPYRYGRSLPSCDTLPAYSH